MLLCTDLAAEPSEVLAWFVRRWSVEVTFAEARWHLSLEAQPQWSDKAVARTTPVLLGLRSLVSLWARELHAQGRLPHRRTSYYRKEEPTSGDALAAARRSLWADAARFFDREARWRPRGSAAHRAGPPDRPRLPRRVRAKVEVGFGRVRFRRPFQ